MLFSTCAKMKKKKQKSHIFMAHHFSFTLPLLLLLLLLILFRICLIQKLITVGKRFPSSYWPNEIYKKVHFLYLVKKPLKICFSCCLYYDLNLPNCKQTAASNILSKHKYAIMRFRMLNFALPHFLSLDHSDDTLFFPVFCSFDLFTYPNSSIWPLFFEKKINQNVQKKGKSQVSIIKKLKRNEDATKNCAPPPKNPCPHKLPRPLLIYIFCVFWLYTITTMIKMWKWSRIVLCLC